MKLAVLVGLLGMGAAGAQTGPSDYLPEVRLSSGDILLDYSKAANPYIVIGSLSNMPAQGVPAWTWLNNRLSDGTLSRFPTDSSINCPSNNPGCGAQSQLANNSPNYTTTYPFIVTADQQVLGPNFTSNNVLDPDDNDGAYFYPATWGAYDHLQLYNVTATSPSSAQAAGDYITYHIKTGNYSPDYELLFTGATFKQGGTNSNFMKYTRQVVVSTDSTFGKYQILTQDSDTQKTYDGNENGPQFISSPNPIVAKPNTDYYIRIYIYNAAQVTQRGAGATANNVSVYFDDFGPLLTVKTIPDVVNYTESNPPVTVDVTSYPASVLTTPARVDSVVPSRLPLGLNPLLGTHLTADDFTLTADPITPVTNDITTLKIQAKNIQDGNSEVMIVGGVSFPLATSKVASAGGYSYSYDAGTQTLTVTGGNATSYQTLIQGTQYQNTSTNPTVTTPADAATVHPGPGQYANTQRIFNFTTLDSAGQESNISPAYINVYPITLPITKAVDSAYIKVADTPSSTLPFSTAALTDSQLTPPTLTYTLTVSNPGSSAINNVYVTDLLPAGLQYVSTVSATGVASSTPTKTTDATISRDFLKYNVGTLAAGTTATIKIKVSPTTGTTPIKANTNESAYLNTANVYANVTTASDIDKVVTDTDGLKHPYIYPVDTSNTVRTDVIYTKLFKQVNNLTHPTSPVWSNANNALPGDTLQYCIDFYNFGTKDLSSYSVTDSLPKYVKYVGGSLTVKSGTMQTQGADISPANLTQPADGATVDAVAHSVMASGMTVGAGTSGTMCFKATVQ